MADRQTPERRLARRLAGQRPEPSRDFTVVLADRLQELTSALRAPAHLWPLILVYLTCGTVLLILAVLGALGQGPLG